MYHVLLADDEPWALMTLKNLIDWGTYGFDIGAEAEDGEQALHRIDHMKPDLIVSDIRMPGMDGLELLHSIREKKWKSEVLLVSGYTDFEYARTAMQYGCAGYLVKPVEEQELIGYLHKVRLALDERYMAEGALPVDGKQEGGYQSDKIQVQKMVDYIQKHFAQPLTLQVLSGEFKMSESYISSLIKKRTGKGFSEHLMEIRILKAQEYLRTTNESIETIAERVGYPDYFYFTKVYKKALGISPAVYRKQL